MMVAMHTGVFCSTEKPSYFLRFKQIENVFPGKEDVAHPGQGVRVHDGAHDIAVCGNRHVDHVPLHDSRPVLIAQCVAQLHSGGKSIFPGKCHETLHIHDHHRAEPDPADHGPALLFVPVEDVTITQELPALQSYCHDATTDRLLTETVLLSIPLCQFQPVGNSVPEPGLPARFRSVAKNRIDDLHETA